MTSSDFDQQRLKDLEDNLAKERELLKQFEDTLRYETDPRIRARYQQDIERQQQAIANYQQEYAELDDQELLWQYKLEEKTLNMARRTLAILEQEAVGYPSLSRPPQLQINLEKQRSKVAQLEAKLQDLKPEHKSHQKKTIVMPSGQGVVQVEKDRIIKYDFVPLVNKLNEVFDWFGKEGALAFKIRLESKKILEDYVIPRIKKELESKIIRIDRREWAEKRVLIDQLDLKACGDEKERLVENVFVAQCKENYHQLTDWIDDSKSDLLFIVRNRNISDAMQIKEITEQCWQTIYSKLSPLLLSKSRCFVTIFAHSFPGVKPYTNDSNDELYEHKIISLPLNQLRVDNLERWFRVELHEWGLREENERDRQRIEDCVERIKKPCGDVSKTFEQIDEICWEFKERGRISFNAK